MRAIDADRLLTDRMKSKYYHLPNGDIAIPIIDIENAPTIEPERKTGRWIHPTFEMVCKCVCGSCEVLCSFCNEPSIDEYNYCPNCGARMEGVEHERNN